MQASEPGNVLVVRLGAMGDVIHALPAVASLRRRFPRARICWAIEPRWAPLLEANPSIDEVIELPARDWFRDKLTLSAWREAATARRGLKDRGFALAVDLQGLIKSALIARASGAARRFGFAPGALRESAAGVFYTARVACRSAHVVERCLELTAAAGGGGDPGPVEFPLPPGRPSAELPAGDFVLAGPLAGWTGKQWPPEHYAVLAGILWEKTGVPLVLDCPPGEDRYVRTIASAAPPGSCLVHASDLPELIAATRRARAVVGVDSGPLHLAAALGVPGVAVYGRTDPARNGPYGGSIEVLRSPWAATSYKRAERIDPAMEAIAPQDVWRALRAKLEVRAPASTPLAAPIEKTT